MVVVNYSPENVAPTNRTVPYGGWWNHGNVLVEALMRPGVIIKRDVLHQNMLQVTLVEDKQLVKTFRPHGANPTFGKGISLGCRGGVNTISMFSATNTVSKTLLNLAS
jgi:hypothetical protein